MDGMQGAWVVALFFCALAACALLGFVVDQFREANRPALLTPDQTGRRRARALVMTHFYNHAGGLG